MVLYRGLCDFTNSRLNGVRDLNCRSFFTLLSSLQLIIGTFVTESTAVLCCTEQGTAFKNTPTREHFAITLLRTKCVCLISSRSKGLYPHHHLCQIFCHTKNIAGSLITVYCLPKEVYCLTLRRFFVSQKVGAILKLEIVQKPPVSSTTPHHFRGKKVKLQCS